MAKCRSACNSSVRPAATHGFCGRRSGSPQKPHKVEAQFLRWRRTEILLEKCDGASPCQIGRRFVVAAAGVVVEGVIDARVNVNRVALVPGLERGLVGGNAGIDALVEPRI